MVENQNQQVDISGKVLKGLSEQIGGLNVSLAFAIVEKETLQEMLNESNSRNQQLLQEINKLKQEVATFKENNQE